MRNFKKFAQSVPVLLIAVLVFGFFGYSARAAGNVYVATAPTGSDLNDCLTPATACLTLDYAVAVAGVGDIVNLDAGVYDQGATSIAVNKVLEFRGPNSAASPNPSGRATSTEAIIRSSAGTAFNIGADTTFRGLRFEVTGGVLASTGMGTDVVFEKNVFYGVRTGGVSYIYLSQADLTANDNLFTDIDTPMGDIFFFDSTGYVGTNSITNNTWKNITSNNVSVAGGALNLSNVVATLSNNIFQNVDNYGILAANASNLTITGNTFDHINNPFPSPAGNYLTLGAGVRFYDANASTVASITGNTFQNSYLGISVRALSDITSSAITIEQNTIRDNNLSGSYMNALNAGTGTLDLRENFWNSTDDAAILASIGAGASFDPYYTSASYATLVAPLVTSVDSDGAVLNIATSSPRIIKIAFDRDIDPAFPPVVSLSTGGAQVVTDCADADAKTFCFSYTIPATTSVPQTIMISAAKGANGQTITINNGHTFIVDTVAPTFTASRVALDKIVLTFNEAVTTNTAVTAWTVTTPTGTVTSVAQLSPTTIELTVTGITGTLETPVVNYVAVNGTVADVAGNPLADGGAITAADAVAPMFTLLGIRSNNTNPVLAKVGDVVTVYASSSEAVTVATSTIATQAASVVITGGTNIEATFTMTSSEAEGLVPFTLSASDAAGNFVPPVSTVTDSSAVTFDRTAPVVAVTQPFDSSFVRAASLVTFTDSEQTSPECAVTGVFTSCVSGVTTLGSLTGFTALPDGAITLTLRDTDPTGNVGMTTRSLVKDAIAPTAPGTPTAVAGPLINATENTAGVVVAVPLGTSGAAVGDTLELLLGGSSFPSPVTTLVSGADITAGTYSFTVVSGQFGADGAKSLTARVTDQAGNLGAQSGALALTLDTIAPTASVTYSTSTPVRAGQTLTITATFSEAMEITAPSTIAITGSNTLAATAMTRSTATVYTYAHTVGATDGTATVTLGAGTDLAGNPITVVPTSGATFEVDNTIPVISAVTIASNNASTTLAKVGDVVTLSFTTSETTQTPVASINGAAATVAGGPTAWTASRTMLAGDSNGLVVFTIDATDAAGNGAAQVTATTDASAVVFDKTVPTVSSVTTNHADGAYTLGTTIDFMVDYSEPVVVTGNPIFNLTSGGAAEYLSGTGSTTLVFRYTVAATENSTDLDHAGGPINLVGGTIRDLASNNAALTLPAAGPIAAAHAIVIDTTVPTIVSVDSTSANGAYTFGMASSTIPVTVTFSEPVTSAGNVTLTFNTTGSTGTCTFSVSGSNSGTCNYVVASGQATADLDATVSGTIRDGALNAVSSFTPGTSLATNKNIVVDTTNPTVVSVTTAHADGFYASSTAIDFTVTLSENVTVTGIPQISLNSGGFARYLSGSGSNVLTLRYTVAPGDNSADLDYNNTGSFGVAGDIADIAGNNNGGSNPTLPAPSIAALHAIVIDTVAPLATPLPSAVAGPFINAAEHTAGFVVMAPLGTSTAVAGDTLSLLVGGVNFPAPLTAVLTPTDISNGFVNFTVVSGQLGADGVKSLTSRVTDQATNVGPESPVLSLTLDTVAPAAPVLSSVAGNNKINLAERSAIIVLGTAETDSTVSVTLTDINGTAKNLSTTATGGNYSVTIDGSAATAFVDGVISPAITATDLAGNTSATTLVSAVILDSIPPAAPVFTLTNPVNIANVSTTAVTGTGEGNTLISVTVTDGTTTVAKTGTTTSLGVVSVTALNLGTLLDGTVTASATLTDDVGNVSAAGTATATKDTVAPVFSAVAPLSGAYINNITTASLIGFTLSENLSVGTTTFTRTGGAADASSPRSCVLTGTAKTAGAHVLNLSDTVNGCATAETLVDGAIYSISFEGQDLVTNPSLVTTRTNVTYDITPPVVTVTKALNGTSETEAFLFRATTNESTSCTLTLDGNTVSLAAAGGVTHTRSLSGQGVSTPHTQSVSCTDLANNNTVTTVRPFTTLLTLGSSVTATSTNAVFSSLVEGNADLPVGISDLVFSNTNFLDLSSNLSTQSAGTIVLNGSTQDLGNVTTGALVNENLSHTSNAR